MASVVVNLTQIKVKHEIETVLPTYPEYIQQLIANRPDFENNLMAYILTRIPNRHVAISEENMPAIRSQSLLYSPLEQTEIEEIIHQGVFYLINRQETNRYFYNHSPAAISCLQDDWGKATNKLM